MVVCSTVGMDLGIGGGCGFCGVGINCGFEIGVD
jgi:hypothetical protein